MGGRRILGGRRWTPFSCGAKMGRMCGGGALFLLLLGHAHALSHGAFSMEEADGAIATAEQHIVQEQSHIIETLNKKLAQMKKELEMDTKHISDLEKEKTDLRATVQRDRDLLQKTRDVALTNQETLQGVIQKQKEKLHVGKEALQQERKREASLKDELAHVKDGMNRVQFDAQTTQEKYNTLLTQKKEAIQRAKELKEKKAKVLAASKERKQDRQNVPL